MTCHRRFACIALIGWSAAVAAADDAPPKADADTMVPIMEGLGTLEHRITTANPLAQQYFNQGLRLMFAFNHDEAIRAFRAAAKVDPNCAMAYWGIALALGPNYNVEAEKERSKAAYEALQQARALAAGATPQEVAYIDALSKRYSESPESDRKQLDKAYADAMRQLSARYPNDLDAAVLFAESAMDLRPWELWTHDGEPQDGTEEIVSTLEAVLKKAPNHPGANHFYIHAVEASPKPERALDCAMRLGGLMPGAGHMVHMPAHIFLRLGRYDEAADANRRGIEVDRLYIEKLKPEGVYPMMYYPHNIHFLWYVLCMQGRGEDAIETAGQVVDKLPEEMVREMPMLEAFLPTRLFALARFSRWEDIFREKPPAEEFTYATGMWCYARALAYSATGQKHLAGQFQQRLDAVLAATPEDKKVLRHSAAQLLKIASHEVGATLDVRDHKVDAAVERLKKAVRLQDELVYDEPPAWYFSERQALGGALLAGGRNVEAEAAYREDLKLYPDNGWSLQGLERSLRAQNREADAVDVHKRLEKAWTQADVSLR